MAANNVTGHVRLVARARGSKWYVKYRLPDGQQVQKLLGPAWMERGRPPDGHYTRKTAEAELRRLLTDAERGTLPAPHERAGGRSGMRAPSGCGTSNTRSSAPRPRCATTGTP